MSGSVSEVSARHGDWRYWRNEATIQEIWNSEQMQELRASFREGILPAPCHGQLCPPVLGEGDSAS